MPTVLITSDSHGFRDEVKQLKERYREKVDGMIHCGDSELDFNHPAMEGFYKVAGNCDYDPEYEEELIIDIKGLRFFIAHGHHHNVKITLDPMAYRAAEQQATIVCHGHSHLAHATKLGNQLVINPGSIRLPRGRREETYAILLWENSTYSVKFYQLNGKEVKSLSQRFTL